MWAVTKTGSGEEGSHLLPEVLFIELPLLTF